MSRIEAFNYLRLKIHSLIIISGKMFVGLVFSFLISPYTDATFDAELLSKVALNFAQDYYVSCIMSLYNEEISTEEKMEIYKVQKILVEKSYKTCGIYSFEKYIALRSSPNFQYHKNSCFKPMKLIFATMEGKDEFTNLTLRYPMADSLWLVFLNSTIGNFFNDGRLPFNTQLIAVTVMNPDFVELYEVYRVYYGFPIRVVYFGNWTRAYGLRVIKGHIYTRRSDLEGKLIKTGSIENWPMSFMNNGTWDGYYLRIWKELQDAINCTSINLRSIDDATGIETSNGKWNGLVGMLLDEKIDLVASEMNINRERSYVIDFLQPLFFSRHQVFLKKPGNSLEWTSVFKPFPTAIWLCIIAWVFIGSLALAFSFNRSYVSGIDISGNKYNFPRSFFFMIQSLCQQGCEEVPKSLGCRIVFFFAYLLPTVIIPSYSASLISSLTYQAPIIPFDSFQQMIRDGTYKLIVPNNTAEYVQFSNSSDPLYKEAFQKASLYRKLFALPEDQVVSSDTESVERFLCHHSKYSIYAIESIFRMKIERTKTSCTVISLNQALDRVQQSMGLKKYSPFTGLINFHLQKMSEAGIINRIQRALWLRNPELNFSKFNEVDLKDVFQIFVFLLVALIFSIWLLIIEKINSRGKINEKSDKIFTVRRYYE